MRFQEIVGHRCKAWAFMRAGCPYLPLEWHEEDEDDEDDEDEGKREPGKGAGDRARRVVGPERRSRGEPREVDVVAEAEAVVAAYQAARSSPEGAPQEVPAWAGLARSASDAFSREALLALALESALIAGVMLLRGSTIGRALQGGLALDARLAMLFRSRSMKRESGGVVPGSLTEL